jgi:serine/threonine protein kinase
MSEGFGSIGKFTVVGTLGSGAHSTILHVRRDADGRNYALKVVALDAPEDMKFLVQAEHELRVAGMLDHPNLIKVYTLEKIKNWFFQVKKAHLLIEYVNGKTLDTCPRLTMPRLVQVFKAIADGMVHMHRRGVCHGDLKPNNILLSKAGVVKVIDFGLARIKNEGGDRVQGTPEYMAPEQVRNSMINERTDIYNFGATMYRLVTWKLPPSCVEEVGALPMDRKVWENIYKPVEEVNPRTPPKLAWVVNACLQFEAMKRPERMSQVQNVLDRLCDELVKSPEDGLEAMEW